MRIGFRCWTLLARSDVEVAEGEHAISIARVSLLPCRNHFLLGCSTDKVRVRACPLHLLEPLPCILYPFVLHHLTNTLIVAATNRVWFIAVCATLSCALCEEYPSPQKNFVLYELCA